MLVAGSDGREARHKLFRQKRKSKDFVDRTMIKAIGMCEIDNPKERPSARQVAKFLKRALKKYARKRSN
jgi:hypothetical protein